MPSIQTVNRLKVKWARFLYPTKEMPKFDIRNHNPDPAHIKAIIAGKGLSNAQAARLIGVSTRTVDAWTSANDVNHRKCSYAHQWALESLQKREENADLEVRK